MLEEMKVRNDETMSLRSEKKNQIYAIYLNLRFPLISLLLIKEQIKTFSIFQMILKCFLKGKRT